MNATIAMLTWRALLGRRRAALLLALPLVLLVLAAGLRLTGVADLEASRGVLGALVLGTLVPLLALIIGTGVISPEIDDGSIVYVLAKPVSRATIVVTKLAVAAACIALFAALPTLVAGLVMARNEAGVAVAYAIGTLVGGVAYCAVFLLLGVVSKHAVVLGLVYALLWETLIGGYVPGARTLSVQQWAVSVTSALAEDGAVTANVRLAVAVTFLVVATVAATAYASRRLRSLTLTGEE
ncbi:MAG TPA: ABC transporter permease [Pseudonocardiaceae bacterium]|nr:ABC transporter permease [Pseudonocardiaceae bacterium]